MKKILLLIMIPMLTIVAIFPGGSSSKCSSNRSHGEIGASGSKNGATLYGGYSKRIGNEKSSITFTAKGHKGVGSHTWTRTNPGGRIVPNASWNVGAFYGRKYKTMAKEMILEELGFGKE